MPNISTYETPNLGLQPSETGAEAFAQAGRRIGAAYSDMAQETEKATDMLGRNIATSIDTAGKVYDEWETHREIMTGGALSATMFQNIQQAWNNTSKGADPNNPATAGQFREEVLEPALTDFSSHFTTERAQSWAISQMNAMREHMTHKMVADQASAAADAVTVNIKQTANSLSNAARNDPTSLDFALQTVDHSLGHMVDSSPAITPDIAAHVKAQVGEDMKEQIVKSAIWGAIERNPDEGLKMASDPRYSKYISGQEVTQAEAYAKMQRSAALTDQERSMTLRDKQTRDASTAKANEYLTKLGSDDPNEAGSVSAKDILKDPTLEPGTKTSLFHFVQAENKPESAANESAPVYNALLDRIYAPWGTEGKISTMQQLLPYKSQMTRADFNDALRKVQTSQTDQGQKIQPMIRDLVGTYKSTLNTAGGMKINNDQGEYAYRRYVEDQVAESVKNNKDPAELFQPGNSRFLGSPQVLSLFQKSLTQSMQDQAAGLTGKSQSAAIPPRPKEAPANAIWSPGYKRWVTLDGQGNARGY